jgi:hypothetical protein
MSTDRQIPIFACVPSRWMRPEVGAFGLAVLTVLAAHANRSGDCTVRQGTIASHLGVDRSRVCRELAKLTELGEVEKASRHDRDGWQLACAYHLPAVAALHTRCDQPTHQEQTVLNITPLSTALQREDCEKEQNENQATPAVEPVAADWQPTAEDLTWLANTRPELDAGQLTGKFRTYHQGRRLNDPSRAWRMWAWRERGPKQRRSNPLPTTVVTGAPPPQSPVQPPDPIALIRRAGPGLVTTWRKEAARRRPDLDAVTLARPEMLAEIVGDLVIEWRPSAPFRSEQGRVA